MKVLPSRNTYLAPSGGMQKLQLTLCTVLANRNKPCFEVGNVNSVPNVNVTETLYVLKFKARESYFNTV